MRGVGPARALVLLAGVGLAAAGGAGGCSQNCCTVDSYPILLTRAPLGAPPLPTASVGDGGTQPPMAERWWRSPDCRGGRPELQHGGRHRQPVHHLGRSGRRERQHEPGQLGPLRGGLRPAPPLRASFRGWDVIGVPLYPAGDPTFPPQGVLGADLLRGYSVEFRFGALCAAVGSALCSSMTFWGHLDEDASLLEDAGYAVVNFTAFGGGEITAEGNPDFLGLRGPLDVPATRVVLRACAVPDAFSPITGSPRLSRGGLHQRPGGAGAGERRRSVADDRHRRRPPGPERLRLGARRRRRGPGPAHTDHAASGPRRPANPGAAATLRGDLVDADRRSALGDHPTLRSHQPRGGGRQRSWSLRRARAVAAHGDCLVPEPDGPATLPVDLCGAPCDVDPNNTGEAANSAAYLELSGQIPVAVISDGDRFLQGLRFDILPEGPELDGLVGANALGRSRLELDYLVVAVARRLLLRDGRPARGLLGGGPLPPAAGPLVPPHYCFGLGPHGLPASCDPDAGIPAADGSVDAGADDAARTDATDDAPATTDAGTAIP